MNIMKKLTNKNLILQITAICLLFLAADLSYGAEFVNQMYLAPKLSARNSASLHPLWSSAKLVTFVILTFPIYALARSLYHHIFISHGKFPHRKN